MRWARPVQANKLIADGHAVLGEPGQIILVSPDPDDKSRHSTTSTVLHKREGRSYGLKCVHELKFVGLVGVRV